MKDLEPKHANAVRVRRSWDFCRRYPIFVVSSLLTPFIFWAGYKLLIAVDDSFFEPAVLIRNTNIANPDLASLENLEWNEGQRMLMVKDRNRRAAFGYLFGGKYYRASFDPSRNLGPDNSSTFFYVGPDGKTWSAYPAEGPTLSPEPAHPRYLRTVRSRAK